MDTFWTYLTVPHNICFTLPIVIVFLYAIAWRIITLIWQVDVDTKSKSNAFVILRFLNAAEVSFKIVLMTLMITWGFSGLIANKLLNVETVSSGNFGSSVIIAFIVGVFGTRYLLLTFAKLFTNTESVETSDEPQLLGLQGNVTSDHITQNDGTAQVEMPDGQTITVNCRVKAGEPNPSKGDNITFIDYDPVERIFDVKRGESESSSTEESND